MSQRLENLGPYGLAVLLHVVLLGSMLLAVDFSRPTPITPLVIQAKLFEEIPETTPPPVEVKRPEPEPEPEPEPAVEDVQPEDHSEDIQRQAEEEKRQQDLLIEKERLEKLKKQEVEEQKKKEREEVERKKREEAEKEKKRLDIERKRQEDIERQREENERLRKELEQEQRDQEIDDEARRLAAANSPEMARYQYAIAQKIRRAWAVPASAGPETRCSVRVRQLPTGEVVGVNISSCNGDDAVLRSVEAAIRRASPLPVPDNRDLFDPNLTLNLTMDRED